MDPTDFALVSLRSSSRTSNSTIHLGTETEIERLQSGFFRTRTGTPSFFFLVILSYPHDRAEHLVLLHQNFITYHFVIVIEYLSSFARVDD